MDEETRMFYDENPWIVHPNQVWSGELGETDGRCYVSFVGRMIDRTFGFIGAVFDFMHKRYTGRLDST